MKIDPQNYERMRLWFARLVPETIPEHFLTPETDPVACLDAIAARSPAKARQGLAMAIGDIIEATGDWPVGKVQEVDDLLEREGLPSLTELRLRFSKVVQRVVARGSIKSDVEYYAVRNAVELANDRQEVLWKLLAAYEERGASNRRVAPARCL